VGAHRAHAAPVEHDDPLGGEHRRQAVGDGEHGPLPRDPGHGVAQRPFVDRVELRRGLVEEQQRGPAQEGAGDGDALALAARQGGAPGADVRVQAGRQPGHELVQARGGDRGAQRVVVGLGRGVAEVVAQRPARTGASCST
jgi:hypothetical protein